MSSIHDVVDRNPNNLIRLLQIVAVTATSLILLVAILGTHLLYQSYVVKVSRLDALRTSQLIVELERRFVLPSNGDSRNYPMLDPYDLDSVDGRMERFLSPHGILKIKVFALDGRVVYSTDRSIIGLIDDDNEDLKRALSGQTVSTQLRKNAFLDMKSEARFDVDVVETYVPIRNESGLIVGSFEIYQDTTVYRDEVLKGVIMSVSVLAFVLFLVFTIAYMFLKTAVRRLLDAQLQLHDLAVRDSLTGLLNRRELSALGEQEFSRYKRLSVGSEFSPYSVMMIDVDDFKSINDNYGHLVGDQALKQIAQYISQVVRKYSIVGRFGGEEFIVVLPGGSSEDAYSVAERIREGIAAKPMQCETDEVSLTVSIGVSPVSEDDRSFEDTVNRADTALYRAKELGRNQVTAV